MRRFVVNGVAIPLGTHCECGATLASHSQLPPHRYKHTACNGFVRAVYADAGPILRRPSEPAPGGAS